MIEIRDPKKIQQEMRRLKSRHKTVGFVPTMGALHEGHLSLVRASKKENDFTVVSIFVNPTQFGPKEDYSKYPRPIAKDRRLLQAAGVDYLFCPAAQAMYPDGATQIFVEVDPNLSKKLCGRFRPGYFRGVATVVAKLFHIVGPQRAYFGAKDYQQAVIISRMIRGLNFGIEMRIQPTVREKDGLALSSRNAYLSPQERIRARAVSGTLFWLRDQFKSASARNLAALKNQALRRLKSAADKIDYLEMVRPETLETLTRAEREMVAAAACYVGKTRLIDNVIIRPKFFRK